MSTAADRYVDAYRAEKPAGDPWLTERREAAIARFAELGFPTLRTEAWKYTNVAPLTRTAFTPARPAQVTREAVAPFLIDGCRHVVLTNGRLAPELSNFAVAPLSWAERDLIGDNIGSFAALNTALMPDAAVLRLADGAMVQVLHVAAPGGTELFNPRVIVIADVNASATLVESYVGSGVYWTNAVTTILAGQGAQLTHVKLQDEALQGFHTGACRVEIARDAHYRSLVLSSGARLARNEISAALIGEGAQCNLDGIALVAAGQHADATTLLDHRVPHGASRECYKSVVDDDGRSVFQGSILVGHDAQKTDARQMHRALLLSPQAHADAKPELRIFADDVKCAHGATVGDLDAESLFYLRSRGVDLETARGLLIEAFVTELFEPIAAPAIRAALDARLHRWLA